MTAEKQKRGRGGWAFLALVLLIYGMFGLAEPEATVQAFSLFIQIMAQVLPALGLVLLLLFVSNLVLEPSRIQRNLGKGSGIKGWAVAMLGGIASMGPVYAWYPMLRELRQKGMRNGLIAAFLYSRAVKLPLLPLMIHYFGVAYAVVLSLYLIAFSILSGIVIERLTYQSHE